MRKGPKNLRDIKAHVRRANELRLFLQAAAPKCPPQVVSAVAVDLADLTNVASRHQQHVKELLSLTIHRRKSRIGRLLAQIEVNLLFEANYHVRSLQKNLPRLVKHLNS